MDNISNIVLYNDGELELKVSVNEETIWLTQKQLSELFSVEIHTINYHIKNIYKQKELNKNSTIRIFRIVQKEGNREIQRNIEHYNLDMILPTVVLVSERLNPFNPSTSVQYADSGDVFSAACTVGIVPFIPGNNDNAIIIESRIALLLLSHFFFMFLLHFS